MKTTTTRKKVRLSFLFWTGLVTLLILLAVSCFTFRSILQPTEGSTNSTFDVPIVNGDDGGFAITGDASYVDFVLIGVLLPNDWTVTDNISFTAVAYSAQDSSLVVTPGFFTYRDSISQMYEDSVGSDAETHWWGAASIEPVLLDNLDSLYYTLIIHTDSKTGTFNLKYAIGFPDTPADNISENYPITIMSPTAIDKRLQKEISVFPNPSSEYINISYGDIDHGEFLLIDNSGRTVLHRQISSENETIDVTAFEPGIYYATVYAGKGKWSKKIIIE